jgi:hypothetical protein
MKGNPGSSVSRRGEMQDRRWLYLDSSIAEMRFTRSRVFSGSSKAFNYQQHIIINISPEKSCSEIFGLSESTQTEILNGDLEAMSSRLVTYRRKIHRLEKSITKELVIPPDDSKLRVEVYTMTDSADEILLAELLALRQAFSSKCREVEEQNRILNYYIDEVRNLETQLELINHL